jgi:hypothetical protein
VGTYTGVPLLVCLYGIASQNPEKIEQPTRRSSVSTSTEEAPVVAEPVVKETEEVSQSDRDKAMGQAYSAAQRDLRVAHQDEFNRYYQKQCADRGIEWTPRKSKAEQALDTIQDLLTEYPGIAEQLAERLAAQASEPKDTD